MCLPTRVGRRIGRIRFLAFPISAMLKCNLALKTVEYTTCHRTIMLSNSTDYIVVMLHLKGITTCWFYQFCTRWKAATVSSILLSEEAGMPCPNLAQNVALIIVKERIGFFVQLKSWRLNLISSVQFDFSYSWWQVLFLHSKLEIVNIINFKFCA